MSGIYSKILVYNNFLDEVKVQVKNFYNVDETYINDSIKELNFRLFRFLKKNLSFYLEFPYVDKFYRNSYYNYYSSKNYSYSKNVIRISIFKNDIHDSNIFDVNFIKENYLGFFVIRPTFPKVLGRNVINPLAFEDCNFSIVSSDFSVTANSLKLTIDGFPHSSQDGESITCAETTIWSIVEYFSNKYNDYSPLLPSDIHKILSELTFERQMPSKGLQAHQISYALKKVGFGVRVYSKAIFGEEFSNILRIYIESGIPLVACVRGQSIGHAFNIIGRRSINNENYNRTPLQDLRGNGQLMLRDISSVNNEFVFVDDNFAPYRVGNLEKPCLHYDLGGWNECEVTEIIVPLYSKIYMEAGEARFFSTNFLKLCSYAYINRNMSIKTFLCSSRTYKNYLMNLDMNLDIKKLFLNLSMPKFIWVSEIFNDNDFQDEKIDGLILLDATEPKSTHVIGAIIDNVFIRKNISENIFQEIAFEGMISFNDNLKYYGNN